MSAAPSRTLRLYDAHNHLQDERFCRSEQEVWSTLDREPIMAMVVNGACEEDWPAVLSLARERSQAIPSFGYHPWYVRERTAKWQDTLKEFLDCTPSAVGEIGLDRWIKDHDTRLQEEMFSAQMRLAAERDLPVSIHCLQAWGRLVELLENGPRPACGFLLHSYGGPVEMVGRLARLGAYFSLPGYFAHERKKRQRETFRHIPLDRLLIETDAPDQPLPDNRVLYPLFDHASGKALNHPANLRAVYTFAGELLEQSLDSLAEQVERNFLRLFARVLRASGHTTPQRAP